MPSLSIRSQLFLAGLLIALLVITRGHNVLSLDFLPTSTIALFFLMGVYFRQVWVLTLAFIIVWTMDISGLTWSGNGNFCLSHSYLFLLLSYATYWAGGRLFAALYAGNNLKSLLTLSLIAPISGALGYLISAASFHYLSGYFEPNFNEMIQDYAMRLPGHLAGLGFYLVVAVIAHSTLRTTNRITHEQRSA